MSELSIAVQKEVLGKIALRSLVVDAKGTLNVDGVFIQGIDGERGLQTFFEGVGQDVKELGQAGAERLYRKLSWTRGRLGKALQTSINLTRELDAETVTRS